MKLTGKLKEQVEKTTSREEAKETIARAGMLLEDDELDRVAGGEGVPMPPDKDHHENHLDHFELFS